MDDKVFDFLMVLVGAVTAKVIDEAVELAKREIKKKEKGSQEAKPKEP